MEKVFDLQRPVCRHQSVFHYYYSFRFTYTSRQLWKAALKLVDVYHIILWTVHPTFNCVCCRHIKPIERFVRPFVHGMKHALLISNYKIHIGLFSKRTKTAPNASRPLLISTFVTNTTQNPWCRRLARRSNELHRTPVSLPSITL